MSMASDRRLGMRFPIEMDLSYRVGPKTAECVAGRTINISSTGILAQTEGAPAKGSKVHMSLAWPLLLDNRVPLQLIVDGRVVRAAEGQVAIRFERFEFRTSRESSRASLEALADGTHG